MIKGSVIVGSKEKFLRQLRRIAVWDDVNKQTMELITNHMHRVASNIAELYKSRAALQILYRNE